MMCEAFNYKHLKEVRDSFLKMTQQEVADALGVTVLSYQKWESGKCTPKPDNFCNYIKFLISKGYEFNPNTVMEWWCFN